MYCHTFLRKPTILRFIHFTNYYLRINVQLLVRPSDREREAREGVSVAVLLLAEPSQLTYDVEDDQSTIVHINLQIHWSL